MATTYRAYDPDTDLTIVGTYPIKVGETTGESVGNGATSDFTVTGTKHFKMAGAGTKEALTPIIIVQFDPGTAASNITTTESTDELSLECWPVYESTANTDISSGTLSANFVYGCDKFTLGNGLFGETGQVPVAPAALSTKATADPAAPPTGSITATSTTTVICYQVTEFFPKTNPFWLKGIFKATQSSGGSVTMGAAIWIVGA